MWSRAISCLLGCAALGAAVTADPASPLVWEPAVEVASGRAERGPWRQSESRFDYVDDPAVAVDAQGGVAIAWVDQARKAVLFQHFAPDGKARLDQPVDVSRRPETFSWLPRISIAPDGQVAIAWQEIVFSGGSHGGEILVASSRDGGRTFSHPANLSNSKAGDGKGRIDSERWHNGSLDIAAGPDGAVYVAWTEYEGALWISRRAGGGGSFSRPVRIAGSTAAPARGPSLAVGPGGVLHVAWTVGEDEGADIHLATSTDGGASFGRAQRVAPSRTYSDAPKLAVDPAGMLHLVYAESAGGPFDRFHIRHTRSSDAGQSFEPSRDISAPLPAGSAGAGFPALGIDSQGRLYVTWELYGQVRQPPRGLALSVSMDGGRRFTTPSVVPGSIDAAGGFNGSGQGLLMKKLAVNGAGAVAIANSSFRPGSHSRVWLMRGRLPP
ncbi:MAG: sialidase family protein [Ramlibacter sp.]|nr:sialidase family protein [Ramlibacter sp.]